MLVNRQPYLIVLALVALALMGTAFLALQGENPADERGTLTGNTVDAADNSCLKGVTVTAVDKEGVHYTSHEYTDTTGADGFFSLELPPDDYTLTFDADGYQPFESSATYTVKNGKTVNIQESFRLVAETTQGPETNPVGSPSDETASLPTGNSTERQAEFEQAATSSDDGQTSQSRSARASGNEQIVSRQTSIDSDKEQAASTPSTMTDGSRQTPSAQASSSGKSTSPANGKTTSGQDIPESKTPEPGSTISKMGKVNETAFEDYRDIEEDVDSKLNNVEHTYGGTEETISEKDVIFKPELQDLLPEKDPEEETQEETDKQSEEEPEEDDEDEP